MPFEAFNRLIEIHYRYYQWHANSLIALLIAAPLRWTVQGFRLDELLWLIVALIVLYLVRVTRCGSITDETTICCVEIAEQKPDRAVPPASRRTPRGSAPSEPPRFSTE